jgi:hypothetical protein
MVLAATPAACFVQTAAIQRTHLNLPSGAWPASREQNKEQNGEDGQPDHG